MARWLAWSHDRLARRAEEGRRHPRGQASGKAVLACEHADSTFPEAGAEPHGAARRNGLDRLASVAGSTRTWYGSDALGSVRQTLSDSGVPFAVVNYDPWGTVESGTAPTFGFTGELQDATSGLVNLRARWYATGQGSFTSRDPFAGMPEMPYSLHPYQYGYSNPILWTDPSGQVATAGDCSQKIDLCLSELTSLRSYKLGIQLSQFCEWSLSELQSARSGVASWSRVAGWFPNQFQRAIAREVPLVQIVRFATDDGMHGTADDKTLAHIYLHPKTFREAKAGDQLIISVATVHELSHTWAWAWENTKRYNGLDILHGFVQATGGSWNKESVRKWWWKDCPFPRVTCETVPIDVYHIHGNPASLYASLSEGSGDPGEDWAESVAATVFPDYHWYKEPTIWQTYPISGGRVEPQLVMVRLPTMDQARQDYVYAMFRAFNH